MSNEKTGEFILSLAEQSGIKLDEAQTKAITDIATELPEGVAKQIQGSLFTVESALANSDITNKIKAESLDAVDQKMVELATNLGLDEGFLHQLKDVKGTYNRIGKVGDAVLAAHKSALVKAKEGAPKGDQKELQAEIEKLNADILAHGENTITKQDHDDAVTGYEDLLSEQKSAILQMRQSNLFAGKNWSNKDIPTEINVMTSNTLFNTELAAKGLKMVDDNGTLKLQTNEDKPYFVDNKEVTPHNYVESLLAGHKLLEVTKTPPTPPPTPIPGAPGVDASVEAAIAKALLSNTAVVESGATNI